MLEITRGDGTKKFVQMNWCPQCRNIKGVMQFRINAYHGRSMMCAACEDRLEGRNQPKEDVMQEKMCGKCKKTLPLSEFYHAKSWSCKVCARKTTHDNYIKRRDKKRRREMRLAKKYATTATGLSLGNVYVKNAMPWYFKAGIALGAGLGIAAFILAAVK